MRTCFAAVESRGCCGVHGLQHALLGASGGLGFALIRLTGSQQLAPLCPEALRKALPMPMVSRGVNLWIRYSQIRRTSLVYS